jgi:hypothetical protein
MTNSAETIHTIARARGDIAAKRNCLRCKSTFWSEGFGERVCTRCKGMVSWRSGVSGGYGQTRRRSTSRSS